VATTQQKQALRRHRKENGLCIFCGAVAVLKDTTVQGTDQITNMREIRCQQCKEKSKINNKIIREQHEAIGICKNLRCRQAVRNGHKYCDDCNNQSTQRGAISRIKALRQGLCGKCHKVPCLNNLTRCEACHNKMLSAGQIRRDNFIALGKCGKCGLNNIEEGYRHCAICHQRSRNGHAALKLKVLDSYGGRRCVGCGIENIYVLQVDHIHGGGNKHAREIGGRSKMYRWLRDNNYPPGFRILCANCNILAARNQPLPLEIAAAEAARINVAA
jgi:hypothetical protein